MPVGITQGHRPYTRDSIFTLMLLQLENVYQFDVVIQWSTTTVALRAWKTGYI